MLERGGRTTQVMASALESLEEGHDCLAAVSGLIIHPVRKHCGQGMKASSVVRFRLWSLKWSAAFLDSLKDC